MKFDAQIIYRAKCLHFIHFAGLVHFMDCCLRKILIWFESLLNINSTRLKFARQSFFSFILCFSSFFERDMGAFAVQICGVQIGYVFFSIVDKLEYIIQSIPTTFCGKKIYCSIFARAARTKWLFICRDIIYGDYFLISLHFMCLVGWIAKCIAKVIRHTSLNLICVFCEFRVGVRWAV